VVLTFKKLFSFRPNREALVAGAVGYNVDNVNEVPRGKYSSGNAGNLSPTSLKSEDNDPAFWVPASVMLITFKDSVMRKNEPLIKTRNYIYYSVYIYALTIGR